MWKSSMALAAVIVALAGCTHTPADPAAPQRAWNDGIWNSVLGYHGGVPPVNRGGGQPVAG
jgi:hypothetical protein